MSTDIFSLSCPISDNRASRHFVPDNHFGHLVTRAVFGGPMSRRRASPSSEGQPRCSLPPRPLCVLTRAVWRFC